MTQNSSDPSSPNANANTEDFEFAALNEAENYRHALVEEFGPYLQGNVIEIGAGIGQMTAAFKQITGISTLVSVEPDPAFCAKHRVAHPGHHLVEGVIDDVPFDFSPNAIVSINVLEHIGTDREELGKYARLLARRKGHLCLFVPARPEIYAPIDKDFGHFRRYTKPELREKLTGAGFEIVNLEYYNLPGYFAWWLNFCLLKQRTFSIEKVRAYDRVIFPPVHWWEHNVMRPPFGQSLLAIARA